MKLPEKWFGRESGFAVETEFIVVYDFPLISSIFTFFSEACVKPIVHQKSSHNNQNRVERLTVTFDKTVHVIKKWNGRKEHRDHFSWSASKQESFPLRNRDESLYASSSYWMWLMLHLSRDAIKTGCYASVTSFHDSHADQGERDVFFERRGSQSQSGFWFRFHTCFRTFVVVCESTLHSFRPVFI